MRIGLDTSIVLRLLIGQPAALAAIAFDQFERHVARGNRLVVSDLVAAESYFALQHHYGLSKAAALTALDALFRVHGVEASGAAARTLRVPALERAKPGFVDRLIHADYEAQTLGMLSFERAAGKLSGVEVLTS